ncbi:hypothetical protein [Embleya sp. NBC_00896]|uniref:hypothetical protein n=1 Tax=Embleya sp. NBC_00896 TaxID=2975961 RepID=UPI002F90ECFD|nr:hypothetical protein OG928_46070 [Embleya sp. NBC_00896]
MAVGPHDEFAVQERFAATTAALVQWVCTAIGETYGDNSDDRVAQAHGPLGTPFRGLALAYADAWQAEYAAIRACCAGTRPERRRAAAGDAVDTITHLDSFADPLADETVDPQDDILVAEIGKTPHVFLPHPTP